METTSTLEFLRFTLGSMVTTQVQLFLYVVGIYTCCAKRFLAVLSEKILPYVVDNKVFFFNTATQDN